jgi:hypothetical protein
MQSVLLEERTKLVLREELRGLLGSGEKWYLLTRQEGGEELIEGYLGESADTAGCGHCSIQKNGEFSFITEPVTLRPSQWILKATRTLRLLSLHP